MDTEEIALLYFRSFCHRPDDYILKRREDQYPFELRFIWIFLLIS